MCGDRSDCACAVLAIRPQGLSPAGLADLLHRLGRLTARADACRAEVIAEAERVAAARHDGYTSTTAWVVAVSGEPAPVCRSQVAVAAALEEMPQTRAAFAAGEVSESRVRVLAQAQALYPDQFAQDETRLVAQVAAAPAPRIPQLLAAWKRATDPQTAQAEVEQLHAARGLYMSPHWSGMVHLTGHLDPESGGVVLAAIRGLSEPANLDPHDPRTPAQARADALVEICRRHLDNKPGNGSKRPHLQITIGWNTLRQGTGVVDTDCGPLTAETARRLGCDAALSTLILADDDTPVATGPARRTIPPALRRALDLRDQHCTHPGCHTPAPYCDAHHIIHWADGGQTTLTNLRLLCRQHHRTAHHHQPYSLRR